MGLEGAVLREISQTEKDKHRPPLCVESKKPKLIDRDSRVVAAGGGGRWTKGADFSYQACRCDVRHGA